MPIKYTTFTEEEFKFFNNFAEKIENEDLEFEEEEFSRIAVGLKMMLENLKEYQTQRLKINKESRESKKAARDAEGGGRGASAKMTGAVKLVPIDLDAGIFTVQKVKVPAPTPAIAPREIEEEENIAENPEAIAAAVAEATVRKDEQQKKINNARAKAQQKPKQEKKKPNLVRKTGKAAVIEQLCALAPPAVPKHLQEQYDDEETESESEE